MSKVRAIVDGVLPPVVDTALVRVERVSWREVERALAEGVARDAGYEPVIGDVYLAVIPGRGDAAPDVLRVEVLGVVRKAPEVSDDELFRLTRYETIDRYGIEAMHRRQRVVQERLTAEVLRSVIRRVLESGGVRRGWLAWDEVLKHLPFEAHGLDVWDVRWAAEANSGVPSGAISSAWWWRLWAEHEIADPVGWVLAQAEQGGGRRRKRGWAKRLAQMALGGEVLPAMVYQLVKRCRELREQEQRLRQESGREQGDEDGA